MAGSFGAGPPPRSFAFTGRRSAEEKRSSTAASRRPEVGDITERRQAFRHQFWCVVVNRDVMPPR